MVCPLDFQFLISIFSIPNTNIISGVFYESTLLLVLKIAFFLLHYFTAGYTKVSDISGELDNKVF